MGMKQLHFVGAAGIAMIFAATPVPASADVMEGHIVAHDHQRIVIRSGGADTTVMLTPATKIQAITGLLGAQREQYRPEDLVNGLAVKVESELHGDHLEATKVTFKPSDLKTATAVQAGVAEAKHKIITAQTENERRLSQVGQFTEKARVRVYFATGSAAINAKGREDLEAIAHQALATPAYVVRVVGHADSTGSAATNQRLSNQRASAVTSYLLTHGKLPAEKIVGATGLGASVPLDDNTSGPSAQNRRVTVFLLMSKAAERQTPQ